MCQCALHQAQSNLPPPPPAPKNENPLRRALLLDLYHSLQPPPSHTPLPPLRLLQPLITKSTHPPLNHTPCPLALALSSHHTQLTLAHCAAQQFAAEQRAKANAALKHLDKVLASGGSRDAHMIDAEPASHAHSLDPQFARHQQRDVANGTADEPTREEDEEDDDDAESDDDDHADDDKDKTNNDDAHDDDDDDVDEDEDDNDNEVEDERRSTSSSGRHSTDGMPRAAVRITKRRSRKRERR